MNENIYEKISSHFHEEERQKKYFQEKIHFIENMHLFFNNVPRHCYDVNLLENLYHDILRRIKEDIDLLEDLKQNRPKHD